MNKIIDKIGNICETLYTVNICFVIFLHVIMFIYIIREEAQSFATHDLRCRACLPNSELAVWWTSVSRWFLT